MNAAEDWGDTITVMQSPGKRLAKLHKADGTTRDYDNAFHYRAESRQVRGLESVGDLLRELLHQPDRCAVRGEIIPGSNTREMRRLAYPDPETGDAATLRDVPRRWLALDADGVARPDDVLPDDLEGCADAVMAHLPRVFQRTACIVQASAGHGIKPGCRLRLWFWCWRPMSGRELKQWLAKTPLDPSVFNTVQPIYTAAPVFEAGRTDQLPNRLLELAGEQWLACPSEEELAPPPPKVAETVRPACTAGSARARLYVEAALDNAQARIRAASLRHPTILQEACSLARLVHAGLLTQGELHSALWRSAADAGKEDEREIRRVVTFAMNNSSTADVPRELVNG